MSLYTRLAVSRPSMPITLDSGTRIIVRPLTMAEHTHAVTAEDPIGETLVHAVRDENGFPVFDSADDVRTRLAPDVVSRLFAVYDAVRVALAPSFSQVTHDHAS